MLLRYIFDNFSHRFLGFDSNFDFSNKKMIKNILLDIFDKTLENIEFRFGNKEGYDNFKKTAILKAIDSAWIEQVDNLQELKHVVANQSKPVYNYNKEAVILYELMKYSIRRDIIRNLLLSEFEVDEKGNMIVYFP